METEREPKTVLRCENEYSIVVCLILFINKDKKLFNQIERRRST
jgi:hypothetical protein